MTRFRQNSLKALKVLSKKKKKKWTDKSSGYSSFMLKKSRTELSGKLIIRTVKRMKTMRFIHNKATTNKIFMIVSKIMRVVQIELIWVLSKLLPNLARTTTTNSQVSVIMKLWIQLNKICKLLLLKVKNHSLDNWVLKSIIKELETIKLLRILKFKEIIISYPI